MKNEAFTIYPAIDIKNGKCVRLLFGNLEKETIYGDNPLDKAIVFRTVVPLRALSAVTPNFL